ncbi:MAG: hypothetical protein WC365_06875 [Candidatus Babeliales bacterium]|jgi:hypothetical protein
MPLSDNEMKEIEQGTEEGKRLQEREELKLEDFKEFASSEWKLESIDYDVCVKRLIEDSNELQKMLNSTDANESIFEFLGLLTSIHEISNSLITCIGKKRCGKLILTTNKRLL